jgi:hypothetical protein
MLDGLKYAYLRKKEKMVKVRERMAVKKNNSFTLFVSVSGPTV